jgi:hypothetical protein
MINLRFQGRIDPERAAEFWRALRSLITTRACRTCDYGDSPACGHERRAQRVCAAPTGDLDCAILPCLGACATPKVSQTEGATT